MIKSGPQHAAPYGRWSSGRPRGRRDIVEATRADRRQAEQAVIALLLAAGFVADGVTEIRVIVQDNGTQITLGGRKRYVNRDHIRATVGLQTIFFYTLSDGQPNPIATLKTLDVKAIKQILRRLRSEESCAV